MASMCSLSSRSPLKPHSPPLPHFKPTFAITTTTGRSTRRPKRNVSKCSGEPSPPTPDEAKPDPLAAPPSSSPGGMSSYAWCAGIGAAGFLETSYLTLVKLTSAEAFCPLGGGGGGGCGDVLNSPYAVLFGVPLPVFGLVAYGSVAVLGLQLTGKNLISGLGKTEARSILVGLATSMAAASACFLYILSTEFAGVSCPYCLFSAFLSFTLFFILLTDFGFQGIQKVTGLQLVLATLVVAAIIGSYSSQPPNLSSDNFELEPYETEITTKSSPLAVSLAEYLRSVGAKMYGAFWCTHCVEQKQMFGSEAMKIVDYVECFPDGVGKGREMAKECADLGIEGFPTWTIKGQLLSGEQDLRSLAKASGFLGEDLSSPPVAEKP